MSTTLGKTLQVVLEVSDLHPCISHLTMALCRAELFVRTSSLIKLFTSSGEGNASQKFERMSLEGAEEND